MTTETMNIHQALVELKALEKRIEAAIKEGEWVTANKHSNGKIGGIDLREYMENIKSRHQKVTSLIARTEAIKRAVVNSNAVTKVTIAGKEYTVAEAIEMKEIGPDVFEIALWDAIYRLRILSKAESAAMEEAVRVACEEGGEGV